MKLTHLFIAGAFAVSAASGAQNLEFTQYLGQIPVPGPALPLATDADGHLFVGTFDGPNSALYLIEDPEGETGKTTPTLTTIATFPSFVPLRGLQSLQVTNSGDLLVSGDTGSVTVANLWKYTKVPGLTINYTEDVAFRAAADLAPARRSSVAIFADPQAGTGTIIANGLNDMDFFDFSGAHISGPFRVSNNYMREGIYNSRDNVFYAIRNGNGSQEMIRNFVQNVDTSGGTLTTSTLISDGAANGNFGNARQNGYYYADQHQLITLDSDVTIGGTAIPPAVRVWDITDNGTSLTLAYRIEGTSETTKFASIGDAVVSGNRLYVSSSGARAVYVFGPAPAAVNRWSAYEATR
jgi:hypothetical protein